MSKNIDFDRLKYSLTGEYEEVVLEKQLKEKDKEIERLNNIINITKNNIEITMQIIKEQPTDNDEWLLERLNGINNILKGSDKE
jgi:hypothetical protein